MRSIVVVNTEALRDEVPWRTKSERAEGKQLPERDHLLVKQWQSLCFIVAGFWDRACRVLILAGTVYSLVLSPCEEDTVTGLAGLNGGGHCKGNACGTRRCSLQWRSAVVRCRGGLGYYKRSKWSWVSFDASGTKKQKKGGYRRWACL